jgi:hypothetical protein
MFWFIFTCIAVIIVLIVPITNISICFLLGILFGIIGAVLDVIYGTRVSELGRKAGRR